MRDDWLYYSCPLDGTVLLQHGGAYTKTMCDAGCGRMVVHTVNCDRTKPKVCYECTEWVENPLGSA